MTDCVHCIERTADTKDHLIPLSWYPNSTPPGLERWAFPSCSLCNNRYSRVEERLITAFGLCLDREHPLAAGIPQRVLRSLDPVEGRGSPRDGRARAAKQTRVLEGTEFVPAPLTEWVLPNFGLIPHLEYRRLCYMPIDADDLGLLVRKFAKGLAFIENRMHIDETYLIDGFVVEQLDPEIECILDRFGTDLSRGPAVLIRRAAVHGDPGQAVLRIELWGRLKLYALVLRR